MRRVAAIIAFSALSAALSLSFMVLPGEPSVAAAEATSVFAIPDSDGYGAHACLVSGDECGAIVAQSWCSAHGFSRTERYGRDETGAISIACAR